MGTARQAPIRSEGRVSRSAWVLAGISGLLQVAIFPTPSQYWLCWIALAPLFLALVRASKKGAGLSFLVAYFSGIIWYAGSCGWIVHVMNTYGDLPLSVSLGILVLFTLYLGLYHGLFGLLFAVCARKIGQVQALLLAPVIWVAVELARARITGFPWDPLGNAQVDNIPLARLAMFTGVFGISFVIAAVNALLALAFVRSGARSLAGICALLLACGFECGNFVSVPPEHPTQTAVLLQGNLPVMTAPWTEEEYDQTMRSFVEISKEQSQGAALVVWPEQPAPFFSSDPIFRAWMALLADQTHAYLIIGNVGIERIDTAPGRRLFNSATLIDPQGRFLARYDKIHLVPWGEYVPFKNIFWFAKSLTQDVGNFSRGSVAQVFEVDGHRVGTFICYESVFGNEVRQFAANGATLLVNISNDKWFGDYGAPWQHLNMARMRAIENHRWLLRDTNSGITAAIDPEGRVVAQLPRNQRMALKAPFALVNGTTFYTRHGDVFAFCCAIITLMAIAWALVPHGKS